MSVAIQLNNLSKSYGKSRGIENISFEVEKGEVLGFLGPNGAGKTTCIRTLMGLIKASSGSATILGVDALKAPESLRSKIGYLPGVFAVYENYTAWELLRFIASMRGINCDAVILQYAQRLNLDLHRHMHDLSKGNRQKVGVIQAFMHNPDVIFLDEPTSGLDPLVQQEFEAILDEAKARGAAIVLSSHVMSEVEHLADRVAIINEGKLLVIEHISVLKLNSRQNIVLTFDHAVDTALFSNIPSVTDVHLRGNEISCGVQGVETEVLRVAVENGVLSIRTHEPSLAEIFMSFVNQGSIQ